MGRSCKTVATSEMSQFVALDRKSAQNDRMQKTKALFLHVTDAHFTSQATFQEGDSSKAKLPNNAPRTRKDVYAATLKALAQDLIENRRPLAGVIVSGDVGQCCDLEGMRAFKAVLLDELSPLGIDASKIVVVPGNHDVQSGSTPSTRDRYQNFMSIWREPLAHAVTPLLDGVDLYDGAGIDLSESPERHILRDPGGGWAIVPINSSNWSQTIRDDISPALIAHVDQLTQHGKQALSAEIQKLFKVDVARISNAQLQGITSLLEDLGPQSVRIAVLHHHLLPVSASEEIRPFADILNLGLLRQFLRNNNFSVVVHGHKHHRALFFDHIYDDDGSVEHPHRTLVISGGNLGNADLGNNDIFQLIELDGLPSAPTCTVTCLPFHRVGTVQRTGPSISRRLWESDPGSTGPVSIFGTDLDDVYARALQAAKSDANRRVLICTIDFSKAAIAPGRLPFPSKHPQYSIDSGALSKAEQLVKWWQLPRSNIEERIPFIHGTRLYRYSGVFDQIDNAIAVLRKRKDSSKAIAVLIDPILDFKLNNKRNFASFCLVQFKGRRVEGDQWKLDCVGYYRAQEFGQWWPVNVAELWRMQVHVCERVGNGISPGLITTITADARAAKNERSPTQVAVPLIDQWLDTDPTHIPMIADLLAGGASQQAGSAGKLWRECLDDLWGATESFHDDGNPVAIDGLKFLAACIKAKGGNSEELVDNIGRLVDVNNGFKDDQDLDKFNDWQPKAREAIAKLRRVRSQLEDSPRGCG